MYLSLHWYNGSASCVLPIGRVAIDQVVVHQVSTVAVVLQAEIDLILDGVVAAKEQGVGGVGCMGLEDVTLQVVLPSIAAPAFGAMEPVVTLLARVQVSFFR